MRSWFRIETKYNIKECQTIYKDDPSENFESSKSSDDFQWWMFPAALGISMIIPAIICILPWWGSLFIIVGSIVIIGGICYYVSQKK
jgi:hypothetical protein